jgi:hypothetical protein
MFLEGNGKLIFGYEKRLTFANFRFHTLEGRFHTLGYEKIGCFFLMMQGTTYYVLNVEDL